MKRQWLFVLCFLPVYWLGCAGVVWAISEVNRHDNRRVDCWVDWSDVATRSPAMPLLKCR
jgi:hypothetical protein